MTTLAQKVAEFPASTPDWEIAAVLNAPDPALPMKLTSRHIGAGTIIETMGLGAVGGGVFISKLRGWAANPETIPEQLSNNVKDIAEILPVIDRGDLEMSNNSVRTMIDTLAALGHITQAQATALKALANDVNQSWAEANGVEVTPRTVGLARGAV
jgi:hypothetical protein